ncbi:ferredoxin--NADP reductase [Desulfogranum japonicum]|uniref:ferredoxin--NADP reductase n=1 Tax=Desulfogranum japonicum TaxID=231447 RepID=UPI0003F6F36F|nr:FAD-binding oxidoreductase [Desulfogranum japonicum]
MAEKLKGENAVNRVTLLDRVWLSEDTFQLKCTRPEEFTFLPGQHVSFSVGNFCREYTMVSADTDDFLLFLIKRLPEGKLSPQLADMPLQTQIAISPPAGYLVNRNSPDMQVFVATGTGIAPFISMVRSGARDFTLIHGARDRVELFYEKELQKHAASYIRCLTTSKAVNCNLEGFYSGRVTSFLKKSFTEGRYAFYLCGVWEMIQEVTHIIDERFPASVIYSEGY